MSNYSREKGCYHCSKNKNCSIPNPEKCGESVKNQNCQCIICTRARRGKGRQ